MIFRNGSLIFLYSLSSTLALSQNAFVPKLDTLASDFIKSISNDDKEKVFVQTNKWFYAAGEDIWLRAYCIGALSHKTMRQSKSLFVDLVSEQDSLVGQIMLNNGLLKLDGRISLPTALPEGYYWLRAYTRRQLQQDPRTVYVQPVYVFNPGKRDAHAIAHEIEDPISNPADTGRPSVRFYPEGGVLIAGANTKLAFSAFDRQGRPMEVFGYVTDSTNAVVAKYSTSAPGLGSFSFFAEAPMRYTVHTIYGTGKVLITQLPAPDAYGYQLSVTSQSADSVFVQVSLGDSVYKKYKPSYVLGVSRDSLCYAAVGKDTYTFSIAKKNFPAGKASLLLFNDKQKTVSQRDFYISKASPELTIASDRSSYGPRQKVKLTVTANNTQDEQFHAVLSVAVTGDRAMDKSAGPNSISLISNDNIEFPGKELKGIDINTYSPDQMDLVMLTQPDIYLGWEKSKDINFVSQPWEQSDSGVTNLTGRILGKKNLPVKNKVITLVSNNGESILETDTTNGSGRFNFRLPDDILDTTRLYFQVSNPKGLQMEDSIVIDSMRFPRFSTPAALKTTFSEFKTKQAEDFKLYQLDSFAVGKGKGWLKPVTVTGRKKTPVTYDESKIVSPFSRIIPGDKIGLNPNSIETALAMTPGVTYGSHGLLIRGGGIGGGEPLLIVDGFQVRLDPVGRSPLINYLETLNPRTIDFIEVLEGADATIYGPGSDGGVVYIHSLNVFRPDPDDEKRGLKLFYACGYYEAPEFQEPDYDKKEIRNSPYPDHRMTIYWNGNVIPDNRGKATLQFFTADGPENYSVFIIGLTSGGEILFATSKIINE